MSESQRPKEILVTHRQKFDQDEEAKAPAGMMRSLTQAITPSRRSAKSKRVAAMNTSRSYHATITLDSGVRIDATVSMSVSPLVNGGQHTLTWNNPIALPVAIDRKPATLPPGSCNLYRYPKVFFDHLRQGKAITPPSEQLFVLDELVKTLVLHANESSSIAFLRDPVGAAPLHALLVANTEASLGLALDIYQAMPSLLTQYHTGKIFTGENPLHILAVNSREDVLCECIVVAANNLTNEQCRGLFLKQATGIFFSDEPMAYYGSTPVAYAVAFSLQRALTTMLVMSKECSAMRGVIDFNDPHNACKHSGFLPLHVAVANSLTSMVNFLLDLPGLTIEYDDMRANPNALTAFGTLNALSLLSPLQVACKLGDKKLVQYILRTQSKQQWVWGPVSLYHLNLHGIDSVGDTGNDVMELVARLDASDATQQMLLDLFMDGILHKLFLQKFRMVRWFHYLMLALQLFSVASLYVLALWMKEDPEGVLYPKSTLVASLPYISLASIAPLLEEDLRASVAWWANARGGPRDEESKKLLAEKGCMGKLQVYGKDMRMLLSWMSSHQMFKKFFGWALAVFGNIWLLWLRTHPMGSAYWDASLATARDRTDIILPFLSFACFLHTEAFFRSFLFEFERLGIFYKTVFKMLGSDVFYWIELFGIFLVNYGLVMYISYPRFTYSAAEMAALPPSVQVSSAWTEPAPKFGSFIGSMQALIELAFIGEPVELDLLAVWTLEDPTSTAPWSLRTGWKAFLFFFFVIFYLVYMIMSLILLLNLLIAMMSDTYAASMEHSTLVWRVDFARRVLRLELQLGVLHRCGLISLHCGEKVGRGRGAEWVWPFKTYQANAEGGGLRGASTSMFDEEVEEEAEEDERDDDGPGAMAPSATVLELQSSVQSGLKKSANGSSGKPRAVTSSKDLAESGPLAKGKSTKRLKLQQKLSSGGGDSGALRVVGATLVTVEHLKQGLLSPRGGAANGAAARAPAAANHGQQPRPDPSALLEVDLDAE